MEIDITSQQVPEGMAVAPGNVFEGAIGGQGRRRAERLAHMNRHTARVRLAQARPHVPGRDYADSAGLLVDLCLLRDSLLAEAPQPIAEATAQLDVARTARQARQA